MADSTPFQQTLDADTSLVADAVYGPAESVILVAPDGTEHSQVVVDGAEKPMRGFYEAVGNDVTPGTSHAPVLSTAPMLHIQISLVQAALGRPLSRRDGFIVRGQAYRVERPLDDGFGMIACKLLEKNDG